MSNVAVPSRSLLVFLLGEQRYALPPDAVERVLRAGPVTPLPDSPAWFLGIFRYRGRVLPVLSLRLLLGMPEQPAGEAGQFVVTRLVGHRVILVVDEVEGLSQSPEADVVTFQRAPVSGLIEGIAADPDGLVLLVRNPVGALGEE